MLAPKININITPEFHTPAMMTSALHYLNKIDFVKTINNNLRWDEKQCKTSPGHLALSVVLSTFSRSLSQGTGIVFQNTVPVPLFRNVAIMIGIFREMITLKTR